MVLGSDSNSILFSHRSFGRFPWAERWFFRKKGPEWKWKLPLDLAVVVKTVLGSHFGVGEFTAHFRLPILVVGLGCSLGGNRACDPWPMAIWLSQSLNIFSQVLPVCAPDAADRPRVPKGHVSEVSLGGSL